LIPLKKAILEIPPTPQDKDYESAVESELDRPKSLIIPKKKKSYAIKYRVIQIKGTEVADNDLDRAFSSATGEMEIKQLTLISLKKDIYE
jgi:hypothetical protein